MSPPDSARAVIDALRLEPLAGEGGYFRSTWRSATASAIFFLLTDHDFSALHRLAQDEIWLFHVGDRIQHVQLPDAGPARVMRIGPDVLAGDHPQVVVLAGTWQGAALDPSPSRREGFALLSCVVSPPWDERDFMLGDRAELIQQFPAEAELIRRLTR